MPGAGDSQNVVVDGGGAAATSALSFGGAQPVALTLAKRPRLLLLDEPLAALDPLARRNFLGALAEAAAGGGLTIVLSSHLIADIERVCDHLILLTGSRVQLCGDTETLLVWWREAGWLVGDPPAAGPAPRCRWMQPGR